MRQDPVKCGMLDKLAQTAIARLYASPLNVAQSWFHAASTWMYGDSCEAKRDQAGFAVERLRRRVCDGEEQIRRSTTTRAPLASA